MKMKQKGSAILVVLAVVAAIIGLGVASYVSAHNTGVKLENKIEAVWEDNENILAQAGLKVSESAQVADKYKDGLKDVLREAMGGRYGDNGSQAVFQWIQEQNPSVDASVYKQIQQVIEASRNEFKNGQKLLISAKQTYKDTLGFLWSGFWMRTAGFPKLDLAKYKIITSEHAGNAFEKGVDKGFNLGN